MFDVLVRGVARSRSLLCLFACVGLHGCVADLGPGASTDASAAKAPATATYRCGGEDGSIRVERASGGVRLTESDGDSYMLPAAPPTQASRFGDDGLALVIEGREALWMKAGSTPLTCVR